LLASAAAALVGWLILRYEHLHAHLSHDGVASGPQKVHTQPTPRVGGLAVLAGLLVAAGVTLVAGEGPLDREFGLLLVTAVPAFVGGLIEDLTKRVGVLERLMLTMLAGALASLVLGAALGRLDVPWVDQALAWLPASVIFTAFAVGGITNAINIIDGYNGLASGFSIIVLIAIAVVANQFGDSLILCSALALAGALAGFMVWNWPRGRMFLGDGGAYLTGFLLAELAVLLVQRHDRVSAWFPLLLMVYPVFETLYSVYRRRAQNGASPGEPDNQHMHQMIHAWMLSRAGATGRSSDPVAMNSGVAKYCWAQALVLAIMGVLFHQSTGVLALIALGYCFCYVIVYRHLARLRKNAA
jgi:UDP-N-acetylmuramyl pentapeptide phosphotransferase/UDP-N-acetylglucosamine-1-phosphate transferase